MQATTWQPSRSANHCGGQDGERVIDQRPAVSQPADGECGAVLDQPREVVGSVVAAQLGNGPVSQAQRICECRGPAVVVVGADVLIPVADLGVQDPGEWPGGCCGFSGSLT
jgi:hypothetical protein